MLSEKVRAEVEQGIAEFVEVFPSVWHQLFEKCVKEGFSEEQAMDLVKTYILSQNAYGIRP